MKRGSKLLTAALLAQLISPPAAGFALLPEPPAHGFVMNLDVSAAPFQSIGYGLTSWRALAELALARWNAAGIGSGPDFNFFGTTNTVVAGNACARDGVNEVTWAASNCGFSYGSAIAITNRWIVNGARAEEDVLFNSNVAYNAYQGPLARAASGSETMNDFFRVAVHEFGHAAGLDHPDQAGQTVTAIMNSTVSDIDALQADDVAGARAIVWSQASATTTTTIATTTTTSQMAPGQIAMQSYFPLRPGYEWTYQDSTSVRPYKRVIGQTPVSINGIPTWVWSDSGGVARYMTNDADGIGRHASGSQSVVPGFGNATVSTIYAPPDMYVPAKVTLGGSADLSGTIVENVSDGSSKSNSYTQTNRFGAERVTVPAGTYTTVRATNVRVMNGVTSTNTIWFADGVGIVKLKYEESTGYTQTYSLSAINFTPAPAGAALNLQAGWNLAGNSSTGTLDVAATFGDAGNVLTVWKWIPGSAKWALYTPSLTAQALANYAGSKGYDVLTGVDAGEGFWINSKAGFTAQLPPGSAVTAAAFQGVASGWHLIAIGDNKTPRELSTALAPTTLWAWDAGQARWYFHAPSLDANGTLSNYIATKGYLDFGAKLLDPVTGFWVNVP